jgi:hypothetical protein
MSQDKPTLEPSFETNLGANCHQRESGEVPIWVVTDINGQLLLSNRGTTGRGSEWVITRGKISVNRFWTSATAYIKCSVSLRDATDTIPPLTNVPPYRVKFGGKPGQTEDLGTDNKFPLGPHDEIVIYTGYANNVFVTAKEIQGLIESGRILVRFVGSVDKVIETISGVDGVSCLIECRDRMKYLMDSLVSYSTADDKLLLESTSTDAKTANGELFRSDVILVIAKKAVGDMTSLNACNLSNCGYHLWQGEVHDRGKLKFAAQNAAQNSGQNSGQPTASIPWNPWRNWTGEAGEPTAYFLGGKVVTDSSLINDFAKINIITGRAPYSNTQSFADNFTISQRVPSEILKQLSAQEPELTEFFCEHRTGDYWYVPKGLDITGLADPRRFYRTYFTRIAPRGVEEIHRAGTTLNGTAGVHPAQMLILFREEVTSISFKSNVVVSNSTNSQTSTGKMEISLKVTPPRLEGRAHPCSYFFLYDATITTAEELLAVSLAYAKVQGRDTRSAVAHFLGDPSLTPGEVIQVVGSSPKSSYEKETVEELKNRVISDREKFLRSVKAYQEFYSKIADAAGTLPKAKSDSSREIEVDSNVVDAPNGKVKIKDEKNTTFSNVVCDTETDKITFVNEVDTLWRIEGFIDRLNDGKPGYYTEVALIRPY